MVMELFIIALIAIVVVLAFYFISKGIDKRRTKDNLDKDFVFVEFSKHTARINPGMIDDAYVKILHEQRTIMNSVESLGDEYIWIVPDKAKWASPVSGFLFTKNLHPENSKEAIRIDSMTVSPVLTSEIAEIYEAYSQRRKKYKEAELKYAQMAAERQRFTSKYMGRK